MNYRGFWPESNWERFARTAAMLRPVFFAASASDNWFSHFNSAGFHQTGDAGMEF